MSGRKNTLLKYEIVTAGDMSQATVTSAVTNIQFMDNIGVQLNVTGLAGSAVGTFALQVSIDYTQDNNGNVTVPGHWITFLQGASNSTDQQIYFDLNQLSAPWIRLVYTKTSGTGHFDAFITGKAI